MNYNSLVLTMTKAGTNKISHWLVGLIILAAIIVRFIKLDKVPAGLFYDEIDLGYQARSLLTTGKDYRNTFSPFFFRSFNTDKTSFPIYFSAIPSLFFKSPEYKVRAGAAIAGVFCIILAMIIAYQLTSNKFTAAIVGLVFAFSPWQIQFSRIAFEAIFMLMLFLSAIASFLHWQKTRKNFFFYLSAIFLGLSVYAYRPMSFFAPLVTLLLLIIYFKSFLKQGFLRILVWLFIIGIMIIPFLYVTTIAAFDQPRINQISIFSNDAVPGAVQRNREVDSNDFANPQIGKKAVLSSFFFHNKIVSYIVAFGKNYYSNFSADFLFLTGDPNLRHSPKNTGMLLFVDFVGLAFGLVFTAKNIKEKKYQLLLALLFFSPVSSDLTMDGANHSSRLMLLAGPLLIIIGLGYSDIINKLQKSGRLKLGVLALSGIWLVAILFRLHNYFVHYPIESAKFFGYGFKQSIEKIEQFNGQYKKIRLTESGDPPMLYYFFWANVPPKLVQQYGTEFGEDVVKNQPLDFVKPILPKKQMCRMDEIVNLNPDTIYMLTYGDLSMDFRTQDADKVPRGIKLLDIVKYPDNNIAYYLVTRDFKNDLPVMPDKETSCR